jgi:tetratricopeptide (TPR) repeat protein
MMLRLSATLIRLWIFLFTFDCCFCIADDATADVDSDRKLVQPLLIVTGLGSVDFPITCVQRDTQHYFNQAVALLHAFDSAQADQFFNVASRLDPDCAMAWWGLAVANLENPKLATEFARRADNLKDRISLHERRWIEALVEYVDQDRDEKSRRLKYVSALDRIATEFPDDIEAKAFLVRQFLDNRDAGFPIQYRSAVEALIGQVERAVPKHPICCYRLRLWGPEQPQRALDAAKRVRQILFSSTPALTAAGRIYSQSGLIEEAIDCYEAAAAAVHQQMTNDRVWFGDVSGSVANQMQLAIHFSRIGRVHEAITLAGQLIKIPNLDPARVSPQPPESSSMPHSLTSTPMQSLSAAELGKQYRDLRSQNLCTRGFAIWTEKCGWIHAATGKVESSC